MLSYLHPEFHHMKMGVELDTTQGYNEKQFCEIKKYTEFKIGGYQCQLHLPLSSSCVIVKSLLSLSRLHW